MYIQYDDLYSVEQVTITEALTRNLALLSFPSHIDAGIVLVTGEFIVLRDSDGAVKAWTFTSLMRRTPAGGVVVLETFPSPPQLFATAADETALSGCTIALYADDTQFGATITSPAGGTYHWSGKLKASLISRIDL